jgi:hypothetical protein
LRVAYQLIANTAYFAFGFYGAGMLGHKTAAPVIEQPVNLTAVFQHPKRYTV